MAWKPLNRETCHWGPAMIGGSCMPLAVAGFLDVAPEIEGDCFWPFSGKLAVIVHCSQRSFTRPVHSVSVSQKGSSLILVALLLFGPPPTSGPSAGLLQDPVCRHDRRPSCCHLSSSSPLQPPIITVPSRCYPRQACRRQKAPCSLSLLLTFSLDRHHLHTVPAYASLSSEAPRNRPCRPTLAPGYIRLLPVQRRAPPSRCSSSTRSAASRRARSSATR